jgi:hypothetical protein
MAGVFFKTLLACESSKQITDAQQSDSRKELLVSQILLRINIVIFA